MASSASSSSRVTPALAVPRTGFTSTGQPCTAAKARTAAWSGAGSVAGTGTPAAASRRAITSLSRNGASPSERSPGTPSSSRSSAAMSRSTSCSATTRAGVPNSSTSAATASRTALPSSVLSTIRTAAAPSGSAGAARRVVT